MLPLGGQVHGQAARGSARASLWCTVCTGAAYAVFEHQKEAIDWVTDSLSLIEEILPFSLLLMLTLVVFALYRAAGSVLERLNGISLAAHNALHTNYGKGTHTNSVITSS